MKSNKAEYVVYVEEDCAILEIKRKGSYSIYSIEENGESLLIALASPSKYTPAPGVLEDPYYVDRLSGEAINKIHILTTEFNYDNLIHNLKTLADMVAPGRYSFTHFSMEMSYVFADYIDVLNQMTAFTDDPSYSLRAKQAHDFFDENFYQKSQELTEEEFEQIRLFFNKEISFLESLKSN